MRKLRKEELNHYVWADIARIIAIFAVVYLHSAARKCGALLLTDR